MVLRTWDRRGNRVNGEAVHSTVEALVPWEGGAGQVCIQPPRTPANTQTKESLPKGPFLKYRTLFCLLRFSQESHFLPKKKKAFCTATHIGATTREVQRTVLVPTVLREKPVFLAPSSPFLPQSQTAVLRAWPNQPGGHHEVHDRNCNRLGKALPERLSGGTVQAEPVCQLLPSPHSGY